MPSYVAAYAYTDFLQYAGPPQRRCASFRLDAEDHWFPDVRTLPGAATMFVFSLYPYVYLLARTAFLERPPALVEAARTLSLNRRQAFLRVEFPLARPAIAAGVALALMETLADYGTVAYFAVERSPPASIAPGFRWAIAPRPRSSRPCCCCSWSRVALERASRGGREVDVRAARSP